jgi:hypothetical protein
MFSFLSCPKSSSFSVLASEKLFFDPRRVNNFDSASVLIPCFRVPTVTLIRQLQQDDKTFRRTVRRTIPFPLVTDSFSVEWNSTRKSIRIQFNYSIIHTLTNIPRGDADAPKHHHKLLLGTSTLARIFFSVLFLLSYDWYCSSTRPN